MCGKKGKILLVRKLCCELLQVDHSRPFHVLVLLAQKSSYPTTSNEQIVDGCYQTSQRILYFDWSNIVDGEFPVSV